MDALCSKPTAGHVKRALLNLQISSHEDDKLAYLYEQAMERINSQDDDSKDLAHTVLSWVTHAIRPLTGVQLQHALATTFSTSELDRDFLPDIEYLLSICAGLITMDGQGVVHWIHYTTQEYFSRTWEKWMSSGKADIERTCLTYLSYEVFAGGQISSYEGGQCRDSDYPLYQYAHEHWSNQRGHLKRLVIIQTTPRAKYNITLSLVLSYSGDALQKLLNKVDCPEWYLKSANAYTLFRRFASSADKKEQSR